MYFLKRLFITLTIMTGIWVRFLEMDAHEAIYGLETVAIILLIIDIFNEIGFSWLFRIYKFINFPLRKYYETREQNYRDVIKKLEQQLYTKNGTQPEQNNKHTPGTVRLGRSVVKATGSNWYHEDIITASEKTNEL